jgi:DNA primase
VDNQVEEIKQKLDIVNVISKYLPLKKRGRHFLANCPFHNEKTPSFTVSPELQIYKCFGCGKGGDVFTFIQDYEHVDFKDALETLAAQAGVALIKNAQISQAESHHKRLIEINHHVARFYNYILTSHPLGQSALKYIQGRGITDQTIKLFQIGYSPAEPRLILNYLQKKGYQPSELTATGSFGFSQYYAGRFYDRFQDRLVFPLADFRDRVLGFSGRVLPPEYQSKSYSSRSDQAKYINSPETDIYHKGQMLFGLNLSKEAIRTQNQAIIVEGEFDLISPYQLGIHNLVALKGTAFTAEQLQLLHRYTDSLVLALDSDFAGNSAAKRSIELADQMGFDLQVLDLGTTYKDPDEAAKADPEFLKGQLAHTIPVWDFLIRSTVARFSADTIRGKSQILSTVLPFLAKISNLVIRHDYYRSLANEIGSGYDSVLQEAQKYEGQKSATPHLPPPPSVSASIDPASPSFSRSEEYLLSLIFSARNPVKVAQKHQSVLSSFTSVRLKPIVEALLAASEFDPRQFQAGLPAEIRPSFEQIFLVATGLNLEPHRRSFEIRKTSVQIITAQLKQKLASLGAQIARLEAGGNQSQMAELERDYNTILSQLSKLQSQKL